MSKVIRLNKGLDIRLKGVAEKVLSRLPQGKSYAVKPTDFHTLIPQVMVKEGDAVLAGSPLFCDKNRPEVLFVSPVSGTVSAIVRGEKRKLLEIVVTPSETQQFVEYEIGNLADLTREEVIQALLLSGLWPAIVQRPYGIIANPSDMPKAVFVSSFDTAPLAPDMDFVLAYEADNFQTGMNALRKLTKGDVHLGIYENPSSAGLFPKVREVKIHQFAGKHPAGNVGVQINHIDPVNKGEVVWTVSPQQVAIIGRLFNKKIYNAEKIIALTGPCVKRPQYFKVMSGITMKAFEGLLEDDGNLRYISGNALTGENVGKNGYMGFYDNQVTILEEGNHYEALGWAKPFRTKKFSFSKSYFSWLCPRKEYALDTNLNGGERAFVASGYYEKVFPMDIYPVQLLKAILAGDVDKMEQLGIYEVIEEDMALCEFICQSKIEVQAILRTGIELMIKEMS